MAVNKSPSIIPEILPEHLSDTLDESFVGDTYMHYELIQLCAWEQKELHMRMSLKHQIIRTKVCSNAVRQITWLSNRVVCPSEDIDQVMHALDDDALRLVNG
ncbi:hypothetical protein Tco_1093657 [Tanacetum coccineum]|uniref:Uncharacterized protein n=1 Tax=Tanacetum coccineum TaxID=301880 RepID=A0ABQ5IDB6_9ASTR